MSLNIRSMLNEDIDTVYEIERNTHITPWNKEIIQDCLLVGYDCKILEFYKEKTNKFEIIGYSIARYYEQSYHLLNICIIKTMQGRGFGKQFLQAILSALENDDRVDYIVLEVRLSNNPALNLYKSLGFEHSFIKKDYYKDSASKEDALVLKKILKKR